MYYVSKRMEIAGALNLNLPYESKCSSIHGHNWIVTVYLKGEQLTEYGMLMDFTHIKKQIHDTLDHKYINEVLLDINPTAENMAKWICDTVNDCSPLYTDCYKVSVQESEGNIAVYEKDGNE